MKNLTLALLLATAAYSAARASGATHYVSQASGGGDGKSWATAWNELERIDWGAVRPGDTINLDGGRDKMVYATTLMVGASGTAQAPIVIRRSSDPGHDGQVVIFGGRTTPLVCGHTADYTFQTEGVRKSGVDFGAAAYVTLDGRDWRGIDIHGHNLHGIHFSRGSSHATVRNVEIYDNGKAMYDTQRKWWNPDQPGVGLTGAGHTFERAIIHDNGQDAFQCGGGLADFTLRDSWVYNGRPHPARPGLAYNYTMHSDGIQVYSGGVQSGVLIEGCVFGPGMMQGTILGQSGPAGHNARVDDVTIRNCLFLDMTNSSIMGYPTIKSRNWTIDRVTAYMSKTNPDGKTRNGLFLEGPGHRITNSIFFGSQLYLPDGAESNGNVICNTDGAKIGTAADPQFVAPPAFDSHPDFPALIHGDFALKARSPAEGKGASVTSVLKLLGRADRIPVPPPVDAKVKAVAE